MGGCKSAQGVQLPWAENPELPASQGSLIPWESCGDLESSSCDLHLQNVLSAWASLRPVPAFLSFETGI